MSTRQKVAAVVAEFLGTYVLASAMLAMLIRTNFEFFSALAAALVYGLMLLMFGNVSGSYLNPVVTLGMWTVRKISTLNAVAYIIAEVAAGFVAWRVGQYFIAQALTETAKGGLDWHVFIAEGVGALIFTFALAYGVAKELDVVKRAVVGGFGLFAGILVASLASDGLLNPAVAIAVRSISWAYMLGPIVGALLGFAIYNIFFNENFTASVKLRPVRKAKAVTVSPTRAKAKASK